MGRRRKLLVPEAREALSGMKRDLLEEHSVNLPATMPRQPVQPDKGLWSTREAGTVGGAIGGQMVRKLVELAKQELETKSKGDG